MIRRIDEEILGRARAFLRRREGSIAVEFALLAPILIVLTIGLFDLARYVIVAQKMMRVSAVSSDLVARSMVVTEGGLTDVFAAAESVAAPFGIGEDGVLIISSVSNPTGDAPVILWQRRSGGLVDTESRIGTAGSAAELNEDFVLRRGENVIIAETFYNFEPVILPRLVAERQIYSMSSHRPRLAPIEEIRDDD